MKFLISLLALFFLSMGAKAQLRPFMLTFVGNASKDSIKINLDTVELQPVGNNWVNLIGDPSKRDLTVTGGNSNNIVVSVDHTKWNSYGGCNCSAFPDNGSPSSTIAPTQVVKECWFSFNVGSGTNTDPYTNGRWRVKAANLKPGSTYKVVMGGTLNGATFNFSAHTEFRVQGLTTSSPITINCNDTPTPVTTVATFPVVQTDTSGNLFFYFNAITNDEMGVCTFITITEN